MNEETEENSPILKNIGKLFSRVSQLEKTVKRQMDRVTQLNRDVISIEKALRGEGINVFHLKIKKEDEENENKSD